MTKTRRRAGLTGAAAAAVLALSLAATPAVAATDVAQSSSSARAAEHHRDADRPEGPLIARHHTAHQTMTLRLAKAGAVTLEDEFMGEYWGHSTFDPSDIVPPAKDQIDWLYEALGEAAGLTVYGVMVRVGDDVCGVDVRTDEGGRSLLVRNGFALASWKQTAPTVPGGDLAVTVHLSDGSQYDAVLPAI